MDWMKILAAVALGAFVIWYFPRVKYMLENSPKGSSQDWMGFVIPIAAVAGFIALLVALV